MINRKFIKGVNDFYIANKKRIKVPIEEFLIYVYFKKNNYPKSLELKLKNLKRDWKKGGYVRGFGTAWMVFNLLKRKKAVSDILSVEEIKKAANYYKKTEIEATMTVSSILDDLGVYLKRVAPGIKAIPYLKIGKLFNLVDLFLTPTMTAKGADLDLPEFKFPQIISKEKEKEKEGEAMVFTLEQSEQIDKEIEQEKRIAEGRKKKQERKKQKERLKKEFVSKEMNLAGLSNPFVSFIALYILAGMLGTGGKKK